ncbi:MAG TPA: hypothetical protein DHU82_00140 [Deltaproteobacteria bacterium]|nr:hypothetical protein [Deltaproteobacteria bacterium]
MGAPEPQIAGIFYRLSIVFTLHPFGSFEKDSAGVHFAYGTGFAFIINIELSMVYRRVFSRYI